MKNHFKNLAIELFFFALLMAGMNMLSMETKVSITSAISIALIYGVIMTAIWGVKSYLRSRKPGPGLDRSRIGF